MSERLKQLIGLDPEENVPNRAELVVKSTRTFDAFVDFLRDPHRFPNSKINHVATLAWRVIGSRFATVTLDTSGRIDNLFFALTGEITELYPIIILPRDFYQRSQKSPVSQLGELSYCTSKLRDFWTDRLVAELSRGDETSSQSRAQAYETETLLTLQRMLANEGEQVNFDPIQRRLIQEFPHGVDSLDRRLRYNTPRFPGKR